MFPVCSESSKSLFFSCYESKFPPSFYYRKDNILRSRLLSSPSIYLLGLCVFQKYCMRQKYKPSLTESASDRNVFHQGQSTSQVSALSPTSVLTIAHFYTVSAHSGSASPSLQNLLLLLPKIIIFFFLALLWTPLFIPEVN